MVKEKQINISDFMEFTFHYYKILMIIMIRLIILKAGKEVNF